MTSRSFRVFGMKKDLENIFQEFQNNNMVNYYRCGQNNSHKITDITKIDNIKENEKREIVSLMNLDDFYDEINLEKIAKVIYLQFVNNVNIN